MNIKNGTYIVGECLGLKEDRRTNVEGQAYTKHFVGLQMPVRNGYAGQATVVDIQFSKEAVADNAMRQFEQHIGKQIMIPVNPMSRAYNGKAYTTNYMDMSRPVVMVQAQVAKAV